MEYFKYTDSGETMIVLVSDYTYWIPMVVGNRYYDDFLIYLEENNLTIDDIPLYIQ